MFSFFRRVAFRFRLISKQNKKTEKEKEKTKVVLPFSLGFLVLPFSLGFRLPSITMSDERKGENKSAKLGSPEEMTR